MQATSLHTTPFTDEDLVKVLANRYGDGTVYRPTGDPGHSYQACLALALISEEGYITRRGRQLAVHYSA